MEVAVECAYISTSCNPVPHCMDWNSDGVVAFGSVNCIVIWEPWEKTDGGGIQSTLVEHKGRVNCVRWLSDSTLLSCCSQGLTILWEKVDRCIYKPYVKISGSGASVSVVDALLKKDHTLVATMALDSTLRIWKALHSSNEVSNIQETSLGSGFFQDVKFHAISSDETILICGGDDGKMHLFIQNLGTEEFVKVLALAGHEDQVMSVHSCTEGSGDVLIATGSQDSTIRLWRLSLIEKSGGKDTEIIQSKPVVLSFPNRNFSICLESVLMGHEGWVHGVQWMPVIGGAQPLALLSTSMDKTAIVWEPDVESGLWLEKVRVGDVGGNTLGLFGGRFSPSGNAILAHGFQGAFHLWKRQKETGVWCSGVVPSGHFGQVADLSWDPEGMYVLSISTDQTTRLHAPCFYEDKLTWFEVGRPQVHGYDLSCLAVLNKQSFASGAEEKVIRVFTVPKNVCENFESLTRRSLEDESGKTCPTGASVPALGLSNKAVYEKDLDRDMEDSHKPHQYPDVYFQAIKVTGPPSEDLLIQNTLWPEIQKVYGHGYEIFSMDASPDGKLLASACKAAQAQHAQLFVWDTHTWQKVCTLGAHTLTVTQIAFSPCGLYLLSVSRDRTWALFGRQSLAEINFEKIAQTDKKTGIHSRIIWSCCWLRDSSHFFTGSRDKKVIVWNRNELKAACVPLELTAAVTAVSCAPTKWNDLHVVAVGLETGLIQLFTWNSLENGKEAWEHIHSISSSICTSGCVRRLRWRPVPGTSEDEWTQLAAASDDHSVRIYNIKRMD